MSAIKKRKLNGASLGAAPPNVNPAKKSAQLVKSKPTAKPTPPPKPVEPESSEEEEEEEEEHEDDEESDSGEQEVQNGTNGTNGEQAAKKTFADLGVIDSLCEACTNLGFKHPTPIQEQSIPIALQGRDM
jgi:ATP-dependent RNA helicase DDX47/RRP3